MVGKKGRIKILSPAHCPTSIEVTLKENGRGVSEGLETIIYFGKYEETVLCVGAVAKLLFQVEFR